MSSVKVSVYATLLAKAREETLAAAAAVPEDRRLYQLGAGKATPLWLLGHLANTVNAVLRLWILERESLLDRAQSMCFAPDFAGGKAPTADPADYAPWEEVVALYDRVMADAIEGVAALEDALLPEPLPGRMPEPLRGFFSSVEFSLGRMVAHDAYHRGQLAMLAKAPR
jgi:hypothetical protein